MEKQPDTVSFRKYKSELDAKNEAYEFILQMKLFNEFMAFCRFNRAKNRRIKIMDDKENIVKQTA